MQARHKLIIRQQLDKTLAGLKATNTKVPVKGWIRAIREALGMSGRQLAQRLKVSQPRIPRLEQDELTGSVTIKTMQQVAEALDCAFVYALVPRTSLENTLRGQARLVAQDRIERVAHSMLLEAQSLSAEEQQKSLEATINELVREMPKELWDK
ncbi:mobile mystery protein A [Trichlorobacter lovleyi]|uniref:Transcriptional regulator, XRE family n=1 Tax=Trichlorobacter lovleyi (strain ATCC BAA-1151 / DSM 17278 / SZ) TaxID=398767 RepID=B3E6D0_TRIL1|nr:mobile mystery protein A [Trichlorobacter lovleyi]ACD96277.1 transcriptional regulator, XRE family [Trichlorobacter lovleyi SZ]